MRKKLKSNRIILLVLLCTVPFWQVFGQDLQIQGKVTDSSTGEGLPGVSIAIKGATQGTTTNLDGMYNISTQKGSVLVFSFVGYKTQELTIESSQTVNIALVTDVEKLSEIVVIGYGTVKKSDATGAVNVVTSKDFNKGAITSPQDLLVGKLAGVNVTSGGGAPGSGFTIRIRGESSLSANKDPLIVIDGVPIASDHNTSDGTSSVAGMANPLSTLNPNDIESFTVLKDASATAIYGSRASNGVILITTKKGGKKFNVSYSGTASLYTVPKMIDVLSGNEFRALINQQYPGTTGNDAIAKSLLGTSNTNWQKEIYQTAFSHDHNLSVSGTVKKIPYRVSLGYTNQDGILKTDNIERTSGAISLSPTLLDDHLHLNFNVKGTYMTSHFANTGAIGDAISFDPTQPVKKISPYEGGYFAWLKNGLLNNQTTANPVAELQLTNNKGIVQRSIGNFEADYKFHFLPDLRINVNGGYDYSTTDGKNFTPDMTSWTPNFGGNKETYTQAKDMELLDIYLNYVKQLDAISSKFDVMAGHSYQHFYRNDKDLRKNVAETTTIANLYTKSQNYLESYFARLNYSLLDRYLLTFTVRNDISSRFSPANRSGVFPSAAFAWKINKESFLTNSKAISDLKLRLGYGSTGQQDIGNDYPYLGVYTLATTDQTAYYQFGNSFFPTLRPEGYDSKIKWETTTTANIGIDFGLFNNRITGSVDYYDKKTKDLLNKISVPAGTNLTNQIYTNVGNMENKGVEFSVNAKVITSKDWQWEFGYNISYNQNKITKLTLTDDPNYQGVAVGGISGGVGNNIQILSVGYPANSFYVYQQVYDSKGNPIEGLYVDRNNDGIINSSDLYRYKKPAPDIFMGISSKLSYKNIDFSFSGRASLGNYVYNNVASTRATYINIYNSAQAFLSNVVKQVNDSKFVNPQYSSDYYVENGSFFRMDYMSLGYNFSKVFNNKVNIRISAIVQNAFIVTNYKGLDPEVFGGIDNNLYPRPRTFLLGINVDL